MQWNMSMILQYTIIASLRSTFFYTYGINVENYIRTLEISQHLSLALYPSFAKESSKHIVIREEECLLDKESEYVI